MNSIIVSDENSKITDSLRKLGYNIINSECIDDLLPFERKHSDIQCLRIDDTFFVANNCRKLKSIMQNLGLNVIETENPIKKDYPDNIILNAVYTGNKLYCKESALDNSVKKYCSKNNIEIINVNQGYTKCSTAVIRNKFITADKGIFNALSDNGAEALLINSGNITLPGCDYGFIGGCCFENNGTVFFTGDLNNHPDGKAIEEFIKKQKVNIKSLTDNELYDIGGFVII